MRLFKEIRRPRYPGRPSQQQLDIGAEFLKDHPEVDRQLVQAADMPLRMTH